MKLFYKHEDKINNITIYESLENGWLLVKKQGEKIWNICDKDGQLIDWADNLMDAVHILEEEERWSRGVLS